MYFISQKYTYRKRCKIHKKPPPSVLTPQQKFGGGRCGKREMKRKKINTFAGQRSSFAK